MLATQNPIEQEGTYPLPEAQLDRFFFKLLVGYPDRRRADRGPQPHHRNARRCSVEPGARRREPLLELQRLVRQVPVASHVKDYAVRLVLATHPKTDTAVPDRQPVSCASAAARAGRRR